MTHSESVAEPGESSFESFDLNVSILCMIVKAKKKRKKNRHKSKIVRRKIGRFLGKKRKEKRWKKKAKFIKAYLCCAHYCAIYVLHCDILQTKLEEKQEEVQPLKVNICIIHW